MRHRNNSSINFRSTSIVAFLAFAVFTSLGPSQPVMAAVGSLQQTFQCANQAFVTQDLRGGSSQGSYLYQINQLLEYDEQGIELLSNGEPVVVNPLGFRRTDRLLYGWRRNRPREMVTIDATGNVTPLGRPAGLPDEAYMAGGITPDGTYMYFVSNDAIAAPGPLKIYKVNLDDFSVTSQQIGGDPSVHQASDSVSDWAVHPITGLLYGADEEGDLAELDPVTGQRNDYPISGLSSGEGYGAAWFGQNEDRLFVHENSGYLHEVDVNLKVHKGWRGTGAQIFRNDGAACVDPCAPMPCALPPPADCELISLDDGDPVYWRQDASRVVQESTNINLIATIYSDDCSSSGSQFSDTAGNLVGEQVALYDNADGNLFLDTVIDGSNVTFTANWVDNTGTLECPTNDSVVMSFEAVFDGGSAFTDLESMTDDQRQILGKALMIRSEVADNCPGVEPLPIRAEGDVIDWCDRVCKQCWSGQYLPHSCIACIFCNLTSWF